MANKSRAWNLSNEMRIIPLLELVIERERSLRFHELWARCKDRMSKPSFVKALGDLERRSQIIRRSSGRKHVEFELHTGNAEVQRMLGWAKTIDLTKERAFEAHSSFVEDSREWLSMSLKSGKPREEIVRGLIFGHAATIASALTRIMFRAVEHELMSGEDALIEALVAEVPIRLYLNYKQFLLKLYKTSEISARRAFNDWLIELMHTSDEFTRSL